MTIDELKLKRSEWYKESLRLKAMLNGIEQTYFEIKGQYLSAKANYEKCEHDLALIDGRLKVIPPNVTSKRRSTDIEPELSMEAIERLAIACGVAIPQVEVPEVHMLTDIPEDDEEEVSNE